MHFDRHMRGRRKSKLESIVVTSTVGVDQRVPKRVSCLFDVQSIRVREGPTQTLRSHC